LANVPANFNGRGLCACNHRLCGCQINELGSVICVCACVLPPSHHLLCPSPGVLRVSPGCATVYGEERELVSVRGLEEREVGRQIVFVRMQIVFVSGCAVAGRPALPPPAGLQDQLQAGGCQRPHGEWPRPQVWPKALIDPVTSAPLLLPPFLDSLPSRNVRFTGSPPIARPPPTLPVSNR
jgi:hypothetical protein